MINTVYFKLQFTFCFLFCFLVGQSQNNSCDTAIAINCGETISGNTADGELSEILCSHSPTPSLWYSIIGQNEVIEFNIISSETDQLVIDLIESPCDAEAPICLSTFDLYSFGPSSGAFFSELNTNYLLQIRTDPYDPGNVGSFSFSVNCFTPAENDQCENALAIECGEIVEGNTSQATPSEDFFCPGNDLWYIIQGDDEIHNFEFISTEFEYFTLGVYTNECPDVNEPIFIEELSPFTEETMRFFAQSGISYLVRVLIDCSDQTGVFSFLHSCPPPYANDFCEDAISINCETTYSGSFDQASLSDEFENCGNVYNNVSDIWYSLDGDGTIFHFSDDDPFNSGLKMNIMEGASCEEDIFSCIYSFELGDGNFSSFLAEAGMTYLIRVYHDYNIEEFSFNVSCSSPATNDNCQDAIELNCEEAYTADFMAASNPGVSNCEGVDLFEPDLWYQITGTDDYISVSGLNLTNEDFYEIEIYTEPCTTNYNQCPEYFQLFQLNENANFFAGENITYWIRIISYSVGSLEFTISCDVIEENDECQNALEIQCGNLVSGNTGFATPTNAPTVCRVDDAEDVWYSYTGMDEIIEFQYILSFSGQLIIEIYQSSCIEEFADCEIFDLNTGDPIKYFYPDPGQTYHIRVYSDFGQTEFEFQVNCMEAVENNDCEQATQVNCGDMLTGNTTMAIPTMDDCFIPGLDPYVWFYIEGNGMVYSFEWLPVGPSFIYMHILENSCDITDCNDVTLIESYPGSTPALVTESGVGYWIGVSTGFDPGEFGIQVNCSDPIVNDECEDAIEFNCEDIVTGSILTATPSIPGNNADVWYSFVGTGEIFKFSYLNGSTYGLDANLYISNCDENDPVFSFYISYDNSVNFLTEAGVVYYVQISSYMTDFGNFSFEVNCVEAIENDSCDSATMLMCGSIVEANTSAATFTNQFNGCFFEEQPDIWYVIEGNDEFFEFEHVASEFDFINFQVIEGGCSNDSAVCYDEFAITPGNNHTVFMASAQTYHIRIFTSEINFELGPLSFSVSCVEEIIPSFSLSDPCICNNDQSNNGSQDGSFEEVALINNTTEFDIWTVVELSSLTGSIPPIGVEVGDELIYDFFPGGHFLFFTHFDDSGYDLTVEGPNPIGSPGNQMLTVSNICSYPEVNTNIFEGPFYEGEYYDLSDLASEINGYEGQYEYYINGEPAEAIDGSSLPIGEYIIEVIFTGDFVSNMSEDPNSPAFPGCITFAESTFSIEELIDPPPGPNDPLVEDIPTMSEWGLIYCFLLLIIFGVVSIQQKDYPIIVEGRQC